MDRKALIRQYKETPRPAGVYRVLNTRSSKALVGTSPDAPAMLNRIRAQLRMGAHPNRDLQQDWSSDGPDGFIFEVLDVLEPKDGADTDPAEELRLLEEMWIERLQLSAAFRY
ncbi:MAG: hypothetical protein AMS20_15510 [Gemmatimonas sp. SG8_28]|jgi:hypothetical protein|nr:MAG: hypothetical protein AMS20_15510 [Gemmatimonas sp. SG8_28]